MRTSNRSAENTYDTASRKNWRDNTATTIRSIYGQAAARNWELRKSVGIDSFAMVLRLRRAHSNLLGSTHSTTSETESCNLQRVSDVNRLKITLRFRYPQSENINAGNCRLEFPPLPSPELSVFHRLQQPHHWSQGNTLTVHSTVKFVTRKHPANKGHRIRAL